MSVADSLIEQNQEEFGHNHDPQESDNPLLSKYFYVESAGKKRTRRQTEEKILEGAGAVKKRSELAETGLFDQAMGSTEGGTVKPESVEFEILRQVEESLRRVPQISSPSPGLLKRKASRELNLCMPLFQGGTAVNRTFFFYRPPAKEDTSRPILKTLQGMLSGAKEVYALMQVHASTKPELSSTVVDMKTKMQELESFLEKANVGLAQGSVLKEDSADAEVKAMREKAQAYVRMADTHKAGMTVARKRWDALLGK